VNERLKRLREIGQSVWVDSLSRDDIQNGNLQRMTEDGVLGVTSNPTILQQAIAQSELYDQELQKLAETIDDAREIFRRIAVRDIRDASDIFMPVYEQTEHKDGYVSLEVSPELAFDTEGTITRAKLLWEMVDRPNLLVKIPATKEGLGAIEESGGVGPILHSASCRFRIPLTYPDDVTVGARIGEVGDDRFVMLYRAVSHGHGAVAADGESLIVTFSYAAGTKAPVSDALRDRLLQLRGDV